MMLLGATGIIPSTRKFIAPKDEPVPTQHFMIQVIDLSLVQGAIN